jgi:site-specific recombinase XerD
LQVGEKLPPLNRVGDCGQALNQYLRRRAVWISLRDDSKQQDEQLTPYSFRHRFAN